MDLGIAGKTALVTGGSKGIGFAVARVLAAEGARVCVSARGEADLQQAVERVRLAGGEAFGVAADVSRAEGVETLLGRVAQRHGAPDILVVNAGGPPAGRAETTPDEAWAEGYDLTLMSAVRLARRAVPAMKTNAWGRVVMITSLSVKQPLPNLTLSNALRAAVTGFAKTLSGEVAASGVTVNTVGPGYTATERLAELFDDEAAQRLLDAIPAKRFATPEEIAAAVVFLTSQQAAYITGQTLIVDGGAVGGLC